MSTINTGEGSESEREGSGRGEQLQALEKNGSWEPQQLCVPGSFITNTQTERKPRVAGSTPWSLTLT